MLNGCVQIGQKTERVTTFVDKYDSEGRPVNIGRVDKNVKVPITYYTDNNVQYTQDLDIGGWNVSPPALKEQPKTETPKKEEPRIEKLMFVTPSLGPTQFNLHNSTGSPLIGTLPVHQRLPLTLGTPTAYSLETEVPLPAPKDVHPIICIPVNTKVINNGRVTTTYGSCFALSDTLLLTAYHNVDEDHIKPFVTVEGKEYPIKVVKFNKKLDIALCEIVRTLDNTEELKLPMLDIGNDAKANDKVFFQGYPRGKYLMSEGQVLERFYSGSLDLAAVKFDHGCSGCPVTNGRHIVGIAISGVPKDGDLDYTKGMYLPASVIKQFLDEPINAGKESSK